MTIGDDVIIGAGCVVNRDIPSNSVVVGNPAKVICTLSEYIEKNKKMMEDHPELVWNSYWKDKSEEEINDMRTKLQNGGLGFDD